MKMQISFLIWEKLKSASNEDENQIYFILFLIW